MVYLDAAATAKYTNTDDIIVNTITQAMRDSWMNPSSLYATNVRNKINKCRANIANFIKAQPDEIYFTSGSSESNNWAIRGWVDQAWCDKMTKGGEDYFPKTPHVITISTEHKSILSLIKDESLSCFKHDCPVDRYGIVILESLERLLQTYESEPILVSVCMANNEIGVVQPIELISDLVHKYNGIFHIDATQAFGHIPIDVEKLGIDMMSVSGHKISPVLKGIGFLYKRNGINIRPLIYGNQENQLRGGTENTFGIIGLSKAIELCDVSHKKVDELCKIRDYFIELLVFKFGCKLNGHDKHRLPNNINVTFPQNITGESLLYMLDTSNVLISTGSACNSKSIQPSYVLKAIGLSDDESMRTVRFSLSDDITYKDIEFVIKEIERAISIITT